YASRRRRYFKGDPPIVPDLADDAANELPGANIWRVIFTPVHNGNARVSAHEAVKDLFTSRRNPCQSETFIDDRRDDRYRLSPADQRIAKPIAVHSHKVGAIYNNCPGGSMLNVLMEGAVLNYGVAESIFQRRVASKCSFLFSLRERFGSAAFISFSHNDRALRDPHAYPRFFSS